MLLEVFLGGTEIRAAFLTLTVDKMYPVVQVVGTQDVLPSKGHLGTDLHPGLLSFVALPMRILPPSPTNF